MSIVLPATLDTKAAGPLRTLLADTLERSEPLHIDGSQVERAGQACLQVLVAARSAAKARGLPFRVEQPTHAMIDMVSLAALDLLSVA